MKQPMKNNEFPLGKAPRLRRLGQVRRAPPLKRPLKSSHSLIAAAVTVALGLTGCQPMESIVAKKAPVPPSLFMKEEKPEPEAKPAEAPSEKKGLTEKEYYPPTGGMVGSYAGRPVVPRGKEGKYTLNFDDADLAEVTKVILGDTLKVNYVLSPKVTGKVSLQTTRPLTDEELIPTLEMLLQTNGAALIKDGPIYRIEPEAGAAMAAPGAGLGLAGQSLPPGYQLRVVPMRYVSVKDMQKVVEPLMPPKSVVRVDEVRNLMLLAGSSEELESAIDTIRMFDVDFMRGMSVGIFPLKNVDAATIIQELEKLLGDVVKGPLAGMLRLLPIQRLNAILAVSPQPRYLDEVESWIERLDRYETSKTSNMHVYRVQNVDAVQLAQTLAQIFGAPAGRGTPAAQLAPGLSGASIGGGAFGGGVGGAFGGTGGGAFGGTGGGAFGGGVGSTAYQVEDQGIGSGSTTGMGTTGGTSGGRIGTPSAGGFGTTGGAAVGGTAGRAAARGSVVAELGNDKRVVADPSNNALIIFAKAQDYKDIEAVIKELDVLPLQVLIDATIVEITLTGNLQYGLQWLFNQGESAWALNRPPVPAGNANNTAAALTALATTGAAGLTPGGFAYALAGKDIKIIVHALAKDNKVNVISSPSLMVLNNQEANINVGDKVPTTTGSSTNLNSATPFVTSQIQYQESGVTLRVRPRVNAGGLVIMDIIQEISTPTPTVVGGTRTFQFAQRKIQSQVAVNNNDTLALGGLIQNRKTVEETGIPYLNKIPGLGWLFGSTTNNVDRTELVVLLTPRVVEKKQDVTSVANEFRRKLTGIFEEYRLDREAPAKTPTEP
jgi:general secretion pathway protein D